MIAYYSMDDTTWSLAVMPSNGTALPRKYALPPTGSRVLRWTRGGTGIVYVDDRDHESTLLLQRLDGGAPETLTRFHASDVVAFDWSPDGRDLAYVRVSKSSDVIRLRGFQE